MKNILLFFLLAVSIQTHCQSKFSEIEKFLNSVGYVYEEKIQTEKYQGKLYEIWLKDSSKYLIPKKYSITGTCFFINMDADSYLITAEHVAGKMSFNTLIVISTENSTPHIMNLKNIVKDTLNLTWTYHKHADVGVLQLDEFKIDSILGESLITFDLLECNLRAPFREREVTVYGYPMSLGVGRKISPITKTSKPSSGLIELPRFDNNKISTFYLLDDPSVSGFSGGPVFELPQVIGTAKKAIWVTIYRIVGLVHGTISDKNDGFAAIVPSYYIKETIEEAPGFSDTLTFLYKNNKLWSKRIYKNGNPYTVLSNLDKDGNPQNMGSLKNGNGTLLIYDENSKLILIRYYIDGKLEKIEIKK